MCLRPFEKLPINSNNNKNIDVSNKKESPAISRSGTKSTDTKATVAQDKKAVKRPATKAEAQPSKLRPTNRPPPPTHKPTPLPGEFEKVLFWMDIRSINFWIDLVKFISFFKCIMYYT